MMSDDTQQNRRANILKAAEELFSEKGFDATSVGSVAKKAGVNKALIYYYFENKDDLIHSLFREIILEMGEKSAEHATLRDNPVAVREKIAKEIDFLAERKQILALLLMETLKSNNSEDFLFRIIDGVIGRELKARGFTADTKKAQLDSTLIHEFFTGVIPVLMFIVLREKFCDYFQFDREKIDPLFLDAFQASHLNSHLCADPQVEKVED